MVRWQIASTWWLGRRRQRQPTEARRHRGSLVNSALHVGKRESGLLQCGAGGRGIGAAAGDATEEATGGGGGVGERID